MQCTKGCFQNKLKEYRLKAGLTQTAVVAQLGLASGSQDRISKWEHGVAAPSLENLCKLCRIYQATLGELYPGL